MTSNPNLGLHMEAEMAEQPVVLLRLSERFATSRPMSGLRRRGRCLASHSSPVAHPTTRLCSVVMLSS